MTDLGDAIKPNGIRSYYTGNVSSSTGDMPYILYEGTSSPSFGMSPMTGIRKAYIFLENVDRVPDMTEREKSIRKAEAKMIIAFHYSQMLRHFGGMPWIDHSYLPEDDMTTTRMTVEETVQKIIGLLDEVARILPWKVNCSRRRQNDSRRSVSFEITRPAICRQSFIQQ